MLAGCLYNCQRKESAALLALCLEKALPTMHSMSSARDLQPEDVSHFWTKKSKSKDLALALIPSFDPLG